MAVFDHNQICTTGNVVEKGGKYQYKEDRFICDVTVLADKSDDDGIGFELQIDRRLDWPEDGQDTFNCWAKRGHYGYSGMWRLYPLGEYMTRAELNEIVKAARATPAPGDAAEGGE